MLLDAWNITIALVGYWRSSNSYTNITVCNLLFLWGRKTCSLAKQQIIIRKGSNVCHTYQKPVLSHEYLIWIYHCLCFSIRNKDKVQFRTQSLRTKHLPCIVIISVVNESYSVVFNIPYPFHSFLCYILPIIIMGSTLSIRHVKECNEIKVHNVFTRSKRFLHWEKYGLFWIAKI